jgi:methyl-accepting chemotaxis protein
MQRRTSIRVKILALSLSAIAATAAIVLAVLLLQRGPLLRDINGEVMALGSAETSKIAMNVWLMCRTMHEQLQLQLDSAQRLARATLQQAGRLGQAGPVVSWDAVNQVSKAASKASLPRMLVGGSWLGQVSDHATPVLVVDRVKQQTGATCTIFQRMNAQGDMLRVATNVLGANGKRAIGTYVPVAGADGAPNPVLTAILAGQPYRGRAFVVDSWYLANYEPLKDDAGRVTGMLYVGIKIENVDSLRKGIMDIKVGKSGYVFVLGGSGDQKGVYIISAKGERDGENILEAKDEAGNFFIKQILDTAMKTKDGASEYVHYPWKNPTTKKVEPKVSACTYFEPWDWVIGAGTYESDYQQALGLVRSSVNRMLLYVVIAALIVIAIAAFFTLGVSNRISIPIMQLARAAGVMAQGDLTVEVAELKSRDETGQLSTAFAEMLRQMRHLIRQVAEAATTVASSSEQLSAGADETGRAVQQVSATMQEVARGAQDSMRSIDAARQNTQQSSKAIEGVSRDIEDVAAYATQAAAQGNEGKKSADEAEGIINHAATSVQQTTKVVHSLGDKTKQIAEFINIITGIADQTNLLALNAAIEAARAGDAGRGFAVVAEEVRKLAEESNGAAGNITKLVRSIEEEMRTALTAMEQSNAEVTSGAKTVSQASQMLSEIVKGVEALTERVQGISAAAEEINASSVEVVQSMQSIAAVAEENAAASEEVSNATEAQTTSMQEIGASAHALASVAQDLQGLLARFKV